MGIVMSLSVRRRRALCDKFVQHIDNICKKYGLQYLDGNGKAVGDIPIAELFKPDTVIYEGNDRHRELLRASTSLIRRNRDILPLEKIKQFAMEWNQIHCRRPLDNREVNRIFNQATKKVSDGEGKGKERRKKETSGAGGAGTAGGNGSADTTAGFNDDEKEKEPDVVEEAVEAVMERRRLLTIKESKEIRYYENGMYVPGGDVLIEEVVEAIFGYNITNHDVTEIKGHIIRKTYHRRAEIDADINIINLKNGLYNLQTGEFKEHSPDYLSFNQVPIVYNPGVKPKLFGKFLRQVLYPSEIRTAIELMAYTFYRDNPFEIITILHGYGSNGKSVFTGLLTALHGTRNISSVPLSDMLDDKFALSDLESKFVNIDAELTSTTIRDTSVLKKLTGRQQIRIQRKNERAYDTVLYAKLFFNANKIPVAYDESDAFFRRKIVLGFPNRFEGKKDDTNLQKKLTTEEETSGIFNVLMYVLRRLLSCNRIYTEEKTIEERRESYTRAANPVEALLEDVVAEDSVVTDAVTKERFYQAYLRFCKKYNLAVLSKESLSKVLKKKLQEGRESTGKRERVWKSIRLKEEYNVDATKQETLDAATA